MIISSERLAFIKSTLPPELFTHAAYLRSLGTLADCLRELAKKPGAVVGQSPQRTKNMLCAMLAHASEGCPSCANERKHGLLPSEWRFKEALAAYEGSSHDRASSLQQIAYVFPPSRARDASEKKLVLIPELMSVLRSRMLPAQPLQNADDQIATPATA
jgi:hypothetical protein